ncbi:alpha-amylase family glycosyl hydrolase [Bacteroidota bacterium]
MRLFFALCLLIFLNTINIAQKITTDPPFPTETDSITITFNAQEADNKALVGYQGQLYTHTGVNTNLSPVEWIHVIGDWGDNDVQPQLTRTADDVYQLVIDNPREFYGVDADERILKLWFVFRGASGNPIPQTEDIYVEIFEEGLNVQISEPASLPIFPEVGEQIDFTVTTNTGDSLFLYIDQILVAQAVNDTLNFTYDVNEAGRKKINAVATDTEGNSASDSSYIITRTAVTVEELPAGVEHGINYIDDNTVTLVLYAPFKDFVYLIGDFNDWEFAPVDNEEWDFNYDYYMNLTPDGTTYWVTLTGLTPLEEYGFQYLVNGNLRISDPYADKILDPWNDDDISSLTYPNLKSYPEEETTNIVSVFQTAQPEYQWQVQDFQRPDQTNLIIYELLIRDFVSTHSYQTLIDTLDYFETLGINAIELMPVFEFEGNESWGYNPMMYFAPDKYYGTKNDLKAFIDAAHQRGIAVILDMVLNHAYGLNPLVRLYYDGANPTEESPWFNVTSPHTCFSWGFDFDHESPATQAFVDRVNNYWLTEYKFDGFRFDFTKGFTNTPSDGNGDDCGNSRDDSRIAILKRMADNIWNTEPGAYVILEHLTAGDEEKILADYGMMLWGNMSHNYQNASTGNISGTSFIGISYQYRDFNSPHLVGYMESHDEERMMYRNNTEGRYSEDYNIKNLKTGLNRVKLASTFFYTVPGPKMLWQFGELGYDYSINYDCRVCNKPVRWDYYDDIERKNLYKTIAALINLKRNYEVFSTEDFEIVGSLSAKRINLTHASMNVTIIGNFGTVERVVNPNFQNTGWWYDFFTGDSVEIMDTQAEITMFPGEFHIYSTVKLPTPEAGIYTQIDDLNESIPYQYSLSQNYPNPFNPSTTINYSLQKPGMVIMKIYNSLGQEVKTLVHREQNSGFHTVIWNGDNNFGMAAASGVYFYTIKTKNFYKAKKLVLIR